MGPIAPLESCCQPSCDSVQTVNIPGANGDDGDDGAAGAPGISPSVLTTAQFLMPAEGANVSVAVTSNAGIAVGAKMFVTGAGTMQVISKTGTQVVTLQNLENTASGLYTDNAASTTAIPSGSLMMPTGAQGSSGALSGAAGGDLNGTYPNPTLGLGKPKGTLIVGDGTVAGDLTVGANNGNNLEVDSTTALGVKWAPKNLAGGANHVTGVLPLVNGGTSAATANAAFNALSPVTTRGDLIYRNATVNARRAIGAINTVLVSDGTDPVYAKLVAANLSAALGVLPLDYILLEYRVGSGVAGGTFTSGGWVTRELNLETSDTGGAGTLASNQYTFNAGGTFRFRGRACGYKCDNHQVRLFNITAGTTIASGGNARSAAAGDDLTWSEVVGRFNIANISVFELQHQCQTTRATDGRGLASSFGINEVYATLEFWREAV